METVKIKSFTYRDEDHSFVGRLFTGEYFWCNASICNRIPQSVPAKMHFAAAEKLINHRLQKIKEVRDELKNKHGVIIVWS